MHIEAAARRLSNIHSLHPYAQARIAVQRENAALCLIGAVGEAVASREAAQEELNTLLRGNAQHRLHRPVMPKAVM